jgi:retinol dehydrogenase 12
VATLAVITGTTHGIGRVTALKLARAGCEVVMLCRNLPMAQQLAARVQGTSPPGRADALHCDLQDLSSVRAAAHAVRERFGPIGLLILNAGVATTRVQRTASGIDLNFAVNHLGHFLLTELLRDRMAPGGRIIGVASLAHYRGRLDLDAVADAAERIQPMASYARSKLANVLHCFALARRLQGTGVTANCLHPGIVATNLLPTWVQWMQRIIRRQMFDEARGAATTLRLALDEGFGSAQGQYFDENARPRTASALACDENLQERLWERSLQWVAEH